MVNLFIILVVYGNVNLLNKKCEVVENTTCQLFIFSFTWSGTIDSELVWPKRVVV